MTNIDQFESVFKSADKVVFAHEDISLDRILVVTDLDERASEEFIEQIRRFLSSILGASTQWQLLAGDAIETVPSLIDGIQQHAPDLICTYRNLHRAISEHPYSLGTHLDVMTQVAPQPVLVFPRPETDAPIPASTDVVMAITDHLTGQHHLVSVAAQFTQPGGKLLLSHIEDQSVFDRYVQTISKIPEIDTDTAREAILRQLLKEARDYIQTCREGLRAREVSLEVEEIVTLGHRLRDYRDLIDTHQAKLLVLNTKDDDQLAMHGLAYPLSVELRNIPLLLL